MLLFSLLVFWIGEIKSKRIVSPNLILSATENFRIFDPVIFPKTFYSQSDVALTSKLLWKKGHKVGFNYEVFKDHVYQSFIIFDEVYNPQWNFQTESPILVVTNFSKGEFDFKSLTIDKEIYFLDTESLNVYEAFVINGIKTINNLGQFGNDFQFIPRSNFVHSFTERRGNFQGLHLKAMIELEPPNTKFPIDFKSKVQYFPENDTYDMTDVVSGYFIDTLDSLKETFNFSMSYYKRGDGAFGVPYQLSNGTTIYPGQMGK